MHDGEARSPALNSGEWRFVLIVSIIALAASSVPYVLGAALATDTRMFGGFVYAVEDCYSYLAKMRQGAAGSWLFHIAYTPEPHRGALFFPFHLLLGKLAALIPGGHGSTVDGGSLTETLTVRMVWVYHGARVIFGLVMLITVYRFLAACTKRVAVRRLALLMVTFGGGLGWLLVASGQPNLLGSLPLDFILPEGFTFLVLYAFPHIALARILLLWGILFLLRAWREPPDPNHASRITHHASRFTFHVSRFRHYTSRTQGPKWAVLAGLLWLTMGLIVPFYVAVAWAVVGGAWLALGLRERRVPWQEGLLAVGAMIISTPILVYSAWVFTSDPVYATWASQNQILSPHPLHYLAAYGVPLLLAAFAIPTAWQEEGLGWLALAWVGVVPVLIYLPFNLQRRLVEGVQVPLSLLAAWGILNFKWSESRLRTFVGVLLVGLSLTNFVLVVGNCLSLQQTPAPIYRDAGEVAALNWLNGRIKPTDVVLAAYETGNYLPARVHARAFVGHGPESIHADEKKALVARLFDAATDDAWRRELLAQYGVDYVFWGPVERALGAFDPMEAEYLTPIYGGDGYALFEVGE